VRRPEEKHVIEFIPELNSSPEFPRKFAPKFESGINPHGFLSI
jgi:hypothetical protein